METLDLLFLLMVANGAPILAYRLFGPVMAFPVDGGRRFIDGHPLLGPSKTWRGIAIAVLSTAWAASLLDFEPITGAQIASWSMLGDACSSFLKRRFKIAASDQALLLDQIPESLFPLLALHGELELEAVDIGLLVFSFLVTELLLSRLLYQVHIRKRPY